jgi:hypothetical protein
MPTEQEEAEVMTSLNITKDVMAVMEEATNTIVMVKHTISLVSAIIGLNGQNAATNIPVLMAHNEYLMQATVQTLRRALALAKEQAGPAAAAAHPDIQLLEETLTYMQSVF